MAVDDEGAGIPAPERPLVTEPFHRACITKPLSFPELTARVEAALRRAATATPDRPRRLRHRDLVVDLDEHRAHLRGEEIRLTPTEFRLLSYLLEHDGQLVTHRQVLGEVWGAGYDVDVHLLRMTIRNLRMKLDAAAPGQSYIATRIRARLPADRALTFGRRRHLTRRRAPGGSPERPWDPPSRWPDLTR